MDLIIRGIRLLPQSSRNKIWIIFLIQFVKFFLEIFSIGLIIPIIYILAKGDDAFQDILKDYEILHLFQIESLNLEKFIIIFLVLIIFIFLIKFVFITYSSYFEQKWLESSNAQTAASLFVNYIHNIGNLSARNNHDAIRNITSEISIFYKFFVKNLIIGFSEIIKLLGILGILFFLNPHILIFGLLIISLTSFIIINTLKKKIEDYGKKRSYNSSLLIKYVTEGLNSIKEIKLSNNPNFFLDKFQNYAEDNAKVQSKFYFLGVLPRQILELFAIILISFLIYYLSIIHSNDTSDALFILGVYVTALFRLMPSINMFYQSGQHILFGKSSLEILEKEFKLNNNLKNFQKTLNEEKLKEHDKIIESINLKNIDFSYSNFSQNIFTNLSYTFNKGKIYCLEGASGSGKSTFINLIMGFLKPQKGEIYFNEKKNIFDNLNRWQKNISYLSQKVFLLNDTIKRNVAFAENDNTIDESLIIKSLKKANLDPEIFESRGGINTFLGDDGISLSGGQKQRVGIARNLYFNKKILILDEFTSSLDKKNEDLIFKSISNEKKDKIIIVISHSQNIKEKCDEILKIDNQNITRSY